MRLISIGRPGQSQVSYGWQGAQVAQRVGATCIRTRKSGRKDMDRLVKRTSLGYGELLKVLSTRASLPREGVSDETTSCLWYKFVTAESADQPTEATMGSLQYDIQGNGSYRPKCGTVRLVVSSPPGRHRPSSCRGDREVRPGELGPVLDCSV